MAGHKVHGKEFPRRNPRPLRIPHTILLAALHLVLLALGRSVLDVVSRELLIEACPRAHLMHLLAVFLASFKIEIAGLDFHRRLNIPAALGHRVTESVTNSLTAAYCTVGGASQSRIRIQLSSRAFVSLFAPRPSAKISTALRPLATNQAYPAEPGRHTEPALR
jgi:hypothetical protein